MNIYPTFPFVNFRFSLTLNIPLVVCRSPTLLNIEPSTGWLQISAPAFLVVSSFPIQLKLNLPLVVCRFPIQLYIKPSTGCLQISASAIHWTYYKGVQNLKNEILYTLLKSGFQKVVSNCFLILLLNLPLIVCLRPFRLQISASAKHRTLHCSSTDYYACDIWFFFFIPVGLAFPHCHRLSGSKFTKNPMVLFYSPIFNTKNFVWDGHGFVEMWAHSPCSWFLILLWFLLIFLSDY